MGEYMDPEERRLYEKGKRDGLEAAALWHDKRARVLKNCGSGVHAEFHEKSAAAIRALKETDQ